MIKLLFVLLFILSGCGPRSYSLPAINLPGLSSKAITVNPDRLIRINGVIIEQMPLLANHVLFLADVDAVDKPYIDILIDSPGGSIFHGNMMVQAIKAAKSRGYTVRCMVTSKAASMAFVIFTYCSERYVFSTSRLLWHQPSSGVRGRVTPQKAGQLKKLMEDLVFEFELQAKYVMGVSDEFYEEHKMVDRWHIAFLLQHQVKASFFTIIDDIRGIDDLY